MIWAIISISLIFVLSFGLKGIFPHLCSICFAVSATWVLGLIFYREPVILGILMGGSAVGLMYYLKLEFLKLPFLLGAFAIIYFVLAGFDLQAALAVLGIWILFGIIYLLRERGGKNWFKKVVECCRNW